MARGWRLRSALYWRGRIFEDQAHDFAQAANYYRALNANYTNYYYGYLARQRLAVLGHQPDVAPAAVLASVRKTSTAPDLVGTVPQDDPHVIKAKLLANAALNEYIGPEISVSAGAAQWGTLAQAQIYASYGEYARSLQALEEVGDLVLCAAAEQASAGVSAADVPAAVVERSGGGGGEERARSLSSGFADKAGV